MRTYGMSSISESDKHGSWKDNIITNDEPESSSEGFEEPDEPERISELKHKIVSKVEENSVHSIDQVQDLIDDEEDHEVRVAFYELRDSGVLVKEST